MNFLTGGTCISQAQADRPRAPLAAANIGIFFLYKDFLRNLCGLYADFMRNLLAIIPPPNDKNPAGVGGVWKVSRRPVPPEPPAASGRSLPCCTAPAPDDFRRGCNRQRRRAVGSGAAARGDGAGWSGTTKPSLHALSAQSKGGGMTPVILHGGGRLPHR